MLDAEKGSAARANVAATSRHKRTDSRQPSLTERSRLAIAAAPRENQHIKIAGLHCGDFRACAQNVAC